MFVTRPCCLIVMIAPLLHVLAVTNRPLVLENNAAMENWFPHDPVTSVGVLNSASQCGLRCLDVGWCMSIIYDFTDNTCFLSDRFSKNGSVYWRPNTTHYQVTSGVVNGYNCDLFSGSCATLLSSLYNWNDGSDACTEKGARLLLIDSADRQLEAEQYMADQGLELVWLGLTDQATEGQWLYEDGTTPVYTHFKAGNPDNYGGVQHCTVIKFSFGYEWDDEECSDKANVVCEMTGAV